MQRELLPVINNNIGGLQQLDHGEIESKNGELGSHVLVGAAGSGSSHIEGFDENYAMLSPAIKSQILDYQLEQNQKHLQHFSPAVNGGLPSFDLMNMSFCLREEFSCVTTTTTRGFDHHNHDYVFP